MGEIWYVQLSTHVPFIRYQVVLLGSAPDPKVQKQFEAAALEAERYLSGHWDYLDNNAKIAVTFSDYPTLWYYPAYGHLIMSHVVFVLLRCTNQLFALYLCNSMLPYLPAPSLPTHPALEPLHPLMNSPGPPIPLKPEKGPQLPHGTTT